MSRNQKHLCINKMKDQTISLTGISILWLTVLPFIVLAQNHLNLSHYPNDTMQECYHIPISKVQAYVYSNLPESYKKGSLAENTFAFSAQTAYSACEIINCGYVYHDWPTLENYLNRILAEILPQELKSDSSVHVYILRDGNFNAFADGSGRLFVNIGIFSEVKNEATIAAILAHELSHYYLKHSFFKMIASDRGDFNLGIFGRSDKLENRFCIKDELQADSLALQLMARSKYNLKAMIDAFEIMGRLENHYISQSEYEFTMKETDHPSSGKRHDVLMDYYNKYYVDTALFFVVSAESFRNFMIAATPEILKCFNEEMDYQACIEQSFRFHLLDPDNILFIHSILESIRRMCYLEPEHWKEMFITNHYYDTTRVNGVLHKIKMKNYLFEKFNFNVLPMNVREASKMKAKFYWRDDPKFKTYNEAFDFYCKVSEALGDHEYLFSRALSYIDDSLNMNNSLRKYLSYDTIEHRQFAEILLNNRPMSLPGDRKLLVFDNFYAKIRLGKVDVPIQSYGHETSNELSYFGDSLANKLTGTQVLYLPSLRKYQMIDYLKLKDLEFLTLTSIMSKKQKLNIFILDPDFREVFSKFAVNEIVFFNCNYFEQRTGKKSLEAYTLMMNKNFKDFLSESRVEKFFSVVISSAKIKDSGALRIAFYSGEKNLDFGDSGYEAVLAVLEREMAVREKRVQEIERTLK
jgi:hypothetical protein